LEEPDCPELVIVLPKEECGWLERRSMGELRRRTLTYLRGRDRHGRLRVVYPTLTADDDQVLNVHAKLLIVDQRIVKIGSSNWSNRSMGLDTECDAWIAPPATDAHGHPQVRALLSRLLAEHLGTEPGRVEQELAAGKSLFALCDALGDGGRTLCALPVHDSDRALTPFDVSMFDLERPELPEAVADVVLPLRPHAPKRRVLWSVTMTLLATPTPGRCSQSCVARLPCPGEAPGP